MAHVLPLFSSVEVSGAEQTPAPHRILLGDELVRSGAIAPEGLEEALEQQKFQDQKLGRILVANQEISSSELTAALSAQSGLEKVDLRGSPPDPTLLNSINPHQCLELGAVPWRNKDGILQIAISNPDIAEHALKEFSLPGRAMSPVLASIEDIRATIMSGCRYRLRNDAKSRTPVALSCRNWTEAPGNRSGLIATALIAAATVVIAPFLALQILMGWIFVANFLTTGLRLTAIFARARKGKPTPEPGAPQILDYRKLPRVSVLVPLLEEKAVARKLLEAMEAMNYPPALLDIKLVLEEHDEITRAAINRATFGPNIQIISVPADGLKTKPRAMNYALPFCDGEIVGVYDAEDRPDPEQIRSVVAHLQSAPREVACVQGYLDFYNTNENWISRCFTLEYAIWFRVILLGVQKLGIPIPLGGTTVFFRRSVLEEIGAWDAHNVTEDADLGIRLARFGYRCEMIRSTTLEEANHRVWPWIKQRSRWLKGYVITWATHMQRPVTLYRDLGFRGFLGFQVLFLGAITSYLSLPLFWLLLTASFGLGTSFWSSLPDFLMIGFGASMIFGSIVNLVVAAVAAVDSGKHRLLMWVPVLHIYWLFGAIAAYRAIFEVFSKPSYWAKTEHGVKSTAGH